MFDRLKVQTKILLPNRKQNPFLPANVVFPLLSSFLHFVDENNTYLSIIRENGIYQQLFVATTIRFDHGEPEP